MFEMLEKYEKECEITTTNFIQEKAKYEAAWRDFQNLFRHLYLFSCCHWGCHGKEHEIEYLAGKTVTNASVAKRAIFHGYYDESLALIRNIGEIANLVNLFLSDDKKYREWIDASDKTRMREFRPAGIREMLKTNEVLVPFEDDHYRFLCEAAVHPVPHRSPNTYSHNGQPVLGLVFQEKGFEVSFWNLLWATSVVCGPIAKMAEIDQSRAEEFVELTIPVFKAVCANGLLVPHDGNLENQTN